MQVEVRRLLATRWPAPIDEPGKQVLSELTVRLEGVRWFLMGRTLLQLMRGHGLDTTDSDIDFGVYVDEYETVRERLDDWPFAIESKHRGRIQQALWYPNDVLVDCHVFYPTMSYVSMMGKYVTRRLSVLDVEPVDTEYGTVMVPGEPEKYVFDDYGENWRFRALKKKRR